MKTYTSPRVMRCQRLEMESTLLTESVVTQSTVIETTVRKSAVTMTPQVPEATSTTNGKSNR